MKFLCLCHYGHSRSVALCRILHQRGHEAVPVGVGTSLSAIKVLGEWADSIAVLDDGFTRFVPDSLMCKLTKTFVIGPDLWSNPYNDDLLKLLEVKARIFFDETNIGLLPCGCHGDVYKPNDPSLIHKPECPVRLGYAKIREGSAGFDGPCFNRLEYNR